MQYTCFYSITENTLLGIVLFSKHNIRGKVFSIGAKREAVMRKDQMIICCLSGRGDKAVAAIARYRGEDIHE